MWLVIPIRQEDMGTGRGGGGDMLRHITSPAPLIQSSHTTW